MNIQSSIRITGLLLALLAVSSCGGTGTLNSNTSNSSCDGRKLGTAGSCGSGTPTPPVSCSADTSGVTVGDVGVASGLSLVDPNGAVVTSVQAQDSLTFSAGGLTANASVRLSVFDPANVALTPAGGLSLTADEDGRIVSVTAVQHLAALAVGAYSARITNADGTDTLAQVTFQVAGSAPLLACTDSTGAATASVVAGTSVFARVQKGGSSLADGTYNVYVILDGGSLLRNASPLATNPKPITVASGNGVVDLGVLNPGSYDVVLDVDNDGLYKVGTDVVTNSARFNACVSVQSAAATSNIVTQIAADRTGTYRDVFDAALSNAQRREVFAHLASPQVSRAASTTTATLYVAAHKDTWAAGDTLTDVSGGTETASLQAGSGNLAPTLIQQRAALQPGCYDVVADVNQNGVYDVGVDFLDNIDNAGAVSCGFRVAQPSCANRVALTSPTNNTQTSATAVTVTGTAVTTPAISSSAIDVFGPTASNSVSVGASGGNINALLPLFQGSNILQAAINYADGSTCVNSVVVTSNTNCLNELIRVQLTWDGSSDSDLHFVRPPGINYSNGGGGTDDCNYGNCKVFGSGSNTLNWGLIIGDAVTSAAAEADDPVLDVDCIGCGNGVENIVMSKINEDGTYGIYVDQFSGSESPNIVTVFIRGVQVGQVNCGAMASRSDTDSCRVGFIKWSGGSNGNGTFVPDGVTANDFEPGVGPSPNIPTSGPTAVAP